MPKQSFVPLYVVVASMACESAPPEPTSSREPPPAVVATPTTATARPTSPAARPEAPKSADPLAGKFTLEDATQGLAGKGALIADVETELGKLECTLYDDKAPTTVANFVGLARGLRPFRTKGTWVTKNAYDGTTFHRIIKGFMIQGGDPEGTGGGEPGYVIPDEVWSGAKHDRRGLMCMANRGPNTNGMQFFITDGAAPHLDRSYTIFGSCAPDAVIEKLAGVEVRGERPIKPPAIQKVTIRRSSEKSKTAKAPKAPAVSPSASP